MIVQRVLEMMVQVWLLFFRRCTMSSHGRTLFFHIGCRLLGRCSWLFYACFRGEYSWAWLGWSWWDRRTGSIKPADELALNTLYSSSFTPDNRPVDLLMPTKSMQSMVWNIKLWRQRSKHLKWIGWEIKQTTMKALLWPCIQLLHSMTFALYNLFY